jgi:uncharacterized phage protein (TIGR02218 family)
VTGAVTSVSEARRVFRDTSRTEATGYFTGGLLTWTSGSNKDATMEVKYHDGGIDEIQLVLPMSFNILVGDQYSVYAGCDKALTTCRDKFSNLVNFRGEPHVPEKGLAAAPAMSQGGGIKSNIK